MTNLKYILRENKRLIMIILIILVCSISIAVGIYMQLTNNHTIGTKQGENNDTNYEEMKNNFEYIFTNSINKETTAKLNINYDELIYCKYDIEEEKNGEYSINAKIPFFRSDNEELNKVNNEIFDIFARKIVDIVNTSTVNTTYNMDYAVYVNNSIVSLIIRCKYKNGNNPQREIIQTYNYDIESQKILSIQDILEYKGLDRTQVQNKINEAINGINNQKKSISEQGYNVYMRDEKSQIYEVDNTPNFFLGKNNYLYLVYAYGNNNYTSEMDLIIF